jgi:hypothetical protein
MRSLHKSRHARHTVAHATSKRGSSPACMSSTTGSTWVQLDISSGAAKPTGLQACDPNQIVGFNRIAAPTQAVGGSFHRPCELSLHRGGLKARVSTRSTLSLSLSLSLTHTPAPRLRRAACRARLRSHHHQPCLGRPHPVVAVGRCTCARWGARHGGRGTSVSPEHGAAAAASVARRCPSRQPGSSPA